MTSSGRALSFFLHLATSTSKAVPMVSFLACGVLPHCTPIFFMISGAFREGKVFFRPGNCSATNRL